MEKIKIDNLYIAYEEDEYPKFCVIYNGKVKFIGSGRKMNLENVIFPHIEINCITDMGDPWMLETAHVESILENGVCCEQEENQALIDLLMPLYKSEGEVNKKVLENIEKDLLGTFVDIDSIDYIKEK